MIRKWQSQICTGLICFLFGAVASLGLVAHLTPMESLPALNLPDKFSILAERRLPFTSDDYIAYFVGESQSVRGEIAVPPESHKNGVLTQVYYTTLAGDRLVHAEVSSAQGRHRLQIVDWDKKVIADVYIDDGTGQVDVVAGSGDVLAQGSRKSKTDAFTLSAPDGKALATISPTDHGSWSVSVENCSKITHVIYALIAGYETLTVSVRAG